MSSSIRIAINSDALTRLAQAIAVVLSATLAGCQTTSHVEPSTSHRAPALAAEFKQKPIFLAGKPTPLAPQDVWERMRQGFQLQEATAKTRVLTNNVSGSPTTLPSWSRLASAAAFTCITS